MTLKHKYNSFISTYDNLWIWVFRLSLYVMIGYILGFILGIIISGIIIMIFLPFAGFLGRPPFILGLTVLLGTAIGFFWAQLEIFRYYFSEPK